MSSYSTTEATPLEHLRDAMEEQLLSLNWLVSNLSDEQYAMSLPLLSGNSIGKHVRHILELLEELLDGQSRAKVDYDNRSRSLELEVSTTAARLLISNQILKINELDADKSLVLSAQYSSEKDGSIEIATSINRELYYNLEHAVHHMAIIQIVLNYTRWLVAPQTFGVAYSTQRHQQQG